MYLNFLFLIIPNFLVSWFWHYFPNKNGWASLYEIRFIYKRLTYIIFITSPLEKYSPSKFDNFKKISELPTCFTRLITIINQIFIDEYHMKNYIHFVHNYFDNNKRRISEVSACRKIPRKFWIISWYNFLRRLSTTMKLISELPAQQYWNFQFSFIRFTEKKWSINYFPKNYSTAKSVLELTTSFQTGIYPVQFCL